MNSIPEPRGALSENRSLADLTWLRVGGPAEYFFQPADTDDLADFLRAFLRMSLFSRWVWAAI